MAKDSTKCDQELVNLYKEWIRQDKNDKTLKEIMDLYEQEDFETLQSLLSNRIEFGTAGLRSGMGAGFSKMNDLIVLQTTQGLYCYLDDKFGNVALKTRGVVIGHDHRHNSNQFAKLSAAVFRKKEIPVYFFQNENPTPLVPWTLLQKSACAGIMITASHNPKKDNGYKVYSENGAQIISFETVIISKFILENLDLWCEDWWSYLENKDFTQNLIFCDKEMNESYAEMVTKSTTIDPMSIRQDVKIVYTAMHGIPGTYLIERLFNQLKLPSVIKVQEQCEPDPDFSTVDFPNPEEGKSSLELAVRTAEHVGALYILANDPDADRMSVSQKLSNQQWKIFNGNEIARILAWWSFQKHERKNKIAMVASAVSSQFLKVMATKENFHFEETLTGFKWIGNKALELKKKGYDVLLRFSQKEVFIQVFIKSYEEAIGFMIGTDLPDKDGLKSSAIMGQIIHYLSCHQSNLFEQLDKLYLQYGYFVSEDSYFICHCKEIKKKLFENLRNRNSNTTQFKEKKRADYPFTCGPYKIIHIRDCTYSFDSRQKDSKCELPVEPSSDMISFYFENGAVATIRSSGTEPKLKYYIELFREIKNLEEKVILNEELKTLVSHVIQDFFEPKKNSLIQRPN